MSDLNEIKKQQEKAQEIITQQIVMPIDMQTVKDKSAYNNDVYNVATKEKENEFIMEQTIEGEAVVVQGKIDCWFEEDDGLVLIDYKNNKIGRYADENKIIEEYKSQIRLYREALEKATGKPVKEAWLYMFRERKFLLTESAKR